MTKDRDNPFYLPIGLTGIGGVELLPRAFGITLRGIIVLGMVTLAVKMLNLSSISPWSLISDTAFLLIRRPYSFQTLVSDIQASGWGIPLLLTALFIFAYITNSHFTIAAVFMANRLSVGDNFSLSEQESRKAGLLLTFLLILSIVGGIILWFELLLSSDSIILRIIRLIAISFFVQIACMLIGGAMACSQAEGKKSSMEALHRMALLIWLEKGHFLRAAAYTLPRWLGISLLSWCTFFLAVVLPFIISDYLLPLWLSFIVPVDSTILHIVRIIVLIIMGLFLLVLWGGLLKTKPHPLLQLISIVGIIATVWCLFILPFFFSNQSLFYIDGSKSWFYTAWHYLIGEVIIPVPWQVSVSLFLVAVIVLLNTVTTLGIWLFLYPLASGICSFFLLRYGAEGKDYHRIGGATQTSSQSSFSVPGTFMFTSGGASALSSLSPPRGWLALAWSGIRPSVLILSLLFAATILVVLRISTDWKYLFGGISAVVLPSLFLPIICREIALSLGERQYNNSRLPSNLLPFRTIAIWLLFIADTAFIVIGVFLGGSLGLIPLVGPIMWGLFYLFMLLGANNIVISIVRWIPGSIILPAVVANDAEWSDKASDILKKTDYYTASAPWTFLGAILAGLPFSLLPALVAIVVFFSLEILYAPVPGQRWLQAFHYILGNIPFKDTFIWPLLGIWFVWGMILLGISVALTNAYLIIRQSVRAP